MGRGSARERLLDAAARRFYEDGVRASIDARHEEWLVLHRERSARASTAVDLVLAVFDAYIDHAEDARGKGFRGCGLLNAAAEFPAGHPARSSVRAHKEQVEKILAETLESMTTEAEALELAEDFSFLLEGAVARSGLVGTPARLEHARAIASRMLAAL